VRKRPVREEGPRFERPEREGLHHVGNATHWIIFENVRILTDPWLMEPAHWTLSHRTPPVPMPTTPEVVLITHGHEDHFDPYALSRLSRTAAVVVPGGRLTDSVEALGFTEVVTLRAGESAEVRGLTVRAVRGQHDVPEVCYHVERHSRSFFFGGDTQLTPEIEALASERPTTFVILPGERSSLLGRAYVMTPEEAIGLAQRFHAQRAVLTHHEAHVSHLFPFGWLMNVPATNPADFPEWFVVPKPGDFVPFPWFKR
jgi:L-ascorbate metabolism protein UlaG (beta-lactamase superfamily)